ncbi:RAB7A-interacting MON1-CCZ1 complex subunit 1 isoform X1 [Pezoporus flaviventris]|uniref:RAB7A-interacting MON1-CCZ1 complex subunit 1 isoform X1 n=1 Tax=Pezoporus flaviventris TaxID=889875 RepID=UPI002AB21DEC|nr:RAB7A-interacting MON1-CCZ1 complex subunit 1 isoform X1 [Pezoporus flaviventris]
MGEPGCAEALGAVSALWPRLAALGRRLAASGGAGSDDTFLAKGSATLDKLKDFRNEGKEHPSTLLQLYTQVAVLDITYFEENQLVDEDFPEECSLQKVKELTCILSEPEVLVRECSINEEPVNILGAELLECLYWRKGALLYMYCHTAKERSEWLQENTAIFKKCLNDGVHYLMKMLSFRCPLQLYEDVSLQDKDSARLLSEGVFSDTHLLAMMYSGEMCYWGLQHCGEGKQESLETTDPVSNSDLGCRSKVWLDFRETGKKMLEKYVAACEGPLKGQGWNTAAAKQMLCYLMKPRN